MMNEQQLLTLFTETLRDVIGDDSIELGMTTRRPDVPGWDSFAYINFIAAVEARLDIRFGVGDVESFETVGDIVRRASAMLGGAAS